MRDITPEQYRRASGEAYQPAVFLLDDGRYAVKGPWVGIDGVQATVIIDPNMLIAALKEQLWSEQ